MYIANFTPDVIKWQHVGVNGKLEPDDITEFDDARGKHILNKWGQRGLIRISYEDKGNEDEKRAEAMDVYNRFWIRQISIFNQHNESLKNENKPYVHPQRQLEDKAKEFKIDLVGPWKVVQPPEGADPKEIAAMKDEMSELRAMMTELMDVTKDATKQRDGAYIEQFADLSTTDFRTWIESNLAKIRKWPNGVQALIKARWDSTQSGEMYPLES